MWQSIKEGLMLLLMITNMRTWSLLWDASSAKNIIVFIKVLMMLPKWFQFRLDH
jgi:hypothetical protein